MQQRPLRELFHLATLYYTTEHSTTTQLLVTPSSVPLALHVAVARLLDPAGVSADVVARPRAVVGLFELALILARPLAQALHENAPVPRPILISRAALEYRLQDAAGGCSSSGWPNIWSSLNTAQEQRRHAEHGQPQQGASSEEGSGLSYEPSSQPGQRT